MQKQSFLFPWDSKWPPRDKGLWYGKRGISLRRFFVIAQVSNLSIPVFFPDSLISHNLLRFIITGKKQIRHYSVETSVSLNDNFLSRCAHTEFFDSILL